MKTDYFSPLTVRLTRQLGVSKSFFDPLSTVDVNRVTIANGADLYREGDGQSTMFVLTEGLLIAVAHVSNGKRYVHRVFQPGDLIGAEDINWTYATTTVQAIGASVLGEFPKRTVFDLMAASPRFGAALHGVSMNDAVVAMDAAKANARLQAMDRVAHFFLQFEARARLTGDAEGEDFAFPITQQVLADAMGLSIVQTNKSIKELIEGRYIGREGRRLTVLNRPAMVRRTDFANRYIVTHDEWVARIAGVQKTG